MRDKKITSEEREDAIKRLRKVIKPGDRITMVMDEYSNRGGWSSFVVMVPVRRKTDGKWTIEIEPICALVAKACGFTRTKNGSVKAYGWGTSRSYEIVYSLGRALFPNGFIPAKAGRVRGRNGTDAKLRDPDGGYALKENLL